MKQLQTAGQSAGLLQRGKAVMLKLSWPGNSKSNSNDTSASSRSVQNPEPDAIASQQIATSTDVDSSTTGTCVHTSGCCSDGGSSCVSLTSGSVDVPVCSSGSGSCGPLDGYTTIRAAKAARAVSQLPETSCHDGSRRPMVTCRANHGRSKNSKKPDLLLKGKTLLAKIKSRKGSRAVMEGKNCKPQGAATAKDDRGSHLGKAVAV